MKKRTSKLEGNVIVAMQQRNELESNIHSYFYWDSRFRKALDKHIMAGKDIIIDLPASDATLHYYRGQGPISFKKAHTYGTQFDKENKAYKPDVFSYEFTVTFDSEEIGELIAKHYYIDVPIDLEDHECSDAEFQKRFNAWIEIKRAEKRANKIEKDMKVLEKLVKKYPTETKQLLK